MKRLWIGVGIMAAVISLLIWGNVTVLKACGTMTEHINRITELVEEQNNYPEAEIAAKELQKSWEHYHSALSAIKNHEELHDLMLNINLIQSHVEKQEKEALLDACDDSLVRLEHIKDGEKVTWGNVF